LVTSIYERPRRCLLGTSVLYIQSRRSLFLVSNISKLPSRTKGSPDPQAHDAEGDAEAGTKAGVGAETEAGSR
jgi:hypothetical protein